MYNCMAIETQLKKWGNSIGIVIPIEIIQDKDFKEGERVIVNIEKKISSRQLFGSLKEWKINTQKFKDEIRKEEHD